MPAKDIYHDCVIRALEKDGWKITDNPFRLKLGKRGGFIDIGAEKLVIAEKDLRKIAVEIKSFIGLSLVNDTENAIGQYILYQKAMLKIEPERQLFLAIEQKAFKRLENDELAPILIDDINIKIIIFDKETEEIIGWME